MLGKLHRETLAEQAATSLMNYIRTRNLQPGDTLPSEAELVTEFGVSRQVIREALKSLQGKGVIEIINGKRPTIKPISSELLQTFFTHAAHFNHHTIIELIEVRKGIEVQSAMLAAQRRSETELAHMEEILAAMRRSVGAIDTDIDTSVDTYIQLDVALHQAIATATHNSMMYHLIHSIRSALIETIREGLLHRHTSEEIERVQEVHEMLVAAIREGNAPAAAQTMAVHFDEALTALMKDA
ncbi:DNA-binding FadR family transcriptional regulator [Thermosporothrix hazakensis]|jgi:DNA-binding FadR family transcriptional regulator|uniref:DNA-binding FadR family transcriptional regulator n=1 Tax=Thermosporothrix hazakensis TaxID=644383 RepID=A0A326U7Z0_THEHA|nr:FadR/GntR family transcriptional regulator [Thermosporothrix hazakensis]PZW29399.1 DNA-binding FadR family transcriptional regulator [Thermosporothrix hazakensis]GCE45886.1 GntR family transcriptional regulator [Thermosporothrix hazakensis]